MNTSYRQIKTVSSWSVITLLVIAGCQNPADDVAGAKVSAPRSEPATITTGSAYSQDPAPAVVPKDSVPLQISSQTSKIEFVGSKVTGKHDGGFKSFEGTWNLVPSKPESSKLSARSPWTRYGPIMQS